MPKIPHTRRDIPSGRTPREITGVPFMSDVSSVKKIPGRPAIVVCVFNRAGGIGKSTISLFLSAYFALRGYATLIIEAEDYPRSYIRLVRNLSTEEAGSMDDRNTAYALMHPDQYQIEKAAFQIDMTAAMDRSNVGKADMNRICTDRRWDTPNFLYLIPGSTHLRNTDAQFALTEHEAMIEDRTFDPNDQLRLSIDRLRSQFDVIIIDTPAALGYLTRNALSASQYALMPMAFDATSISDYIESMKTFRQVESIMMRKGQTPPKFLGFVGNRFSDNVALQVAVLNSYIGPHNNPDTSQPEKQLIPDDMLGNIPLDVEGFDNAIGKHMTIHTFAPTSKGGAAAYQFCQNVEHLVI